MGGVSVIGPDDELTPEQLRRIGEAVAKLGAKREAYRTGMSPAQVNAQTWLVKVELLPTPPLDPSRSVPA